jgi:NTE family protein
LRRTLVNLSCQGHFTPVGSTAEQREGLRSEKRYLRFVTNANDPDTRVGTTARGYERAADLQARFDRAAKKLFDIDGWADPHGQKKLVADLAVEGGGIKGVALAGAVLALDEAGYSFARVAGTSAGAIVATLIAALTKSGRPMTELKTHLDSLEFSQFMPQGHLRHWLEHTSKTAATATDAIMLTTRMGLYSGDYLEEWLGPILAELGADTFGKLKITLEEDPGMSLPEDHRYRVVVHTSDITRGVLVQLPWDYKYYGLVADTESVARAVRASMSIPFFFDPVTTYAIPADVDVPQPGGVSVRQHYAGGTVTWVDGGMLANFPINAFRRVDNQLARWPTIGIKLSSLPRAFQSTVACSDAITVGLKCIHTLLNEWDVHNAYQTTSARTIFVDNAGVSAIQFQLSEAQQQQLFLNGVRAATKFVIEMAAGGGVRSLDSR